MWAIEKIEKCSFCDKKAEYIWFRKGFLWHNLMTVCNKHRLIAIMWHMSNFKDKKRIREEWMEETRIGLDVD